MESAFWVAVRQSTPTLVARLEGRSKKIAAQGRVASNPPLPVADSLDNRARGKRAD